MKLYPIETGTFKLDGGVMFGFIPKALWQKIYPADENNLCKWAMRCLLVVDRDQKILIDNGIGDKQDKKFFSYYYLNGNNTLLSSLGKYGFSADDITDVVLTHLHFDHCGGGVKYNRDRRRLELVFKNATYWSSKQQWDLAVNSNRMEQASFLKENILPMGDSGHLKLIDRDSILFPDFSVKLFNGHTHGQIIPFINYRGETVVFTGDLLPSTAHIPLPYIMSYDVRPLISLEEKEIFLNEAVENNYILFFPHDLYNECCTVHKTGKEITVKETFLLKDRFGE
ncbi:MAG: MBL fold metallo-hydrolase [Syntrophales bacterium]|nr:MBL fold metallo-hydrolase [Syntrophales bacterium]